MCRVLFAFLCIIHKKDNRVELYAYITVAYA